MSQNLDQEKHGKSEVPVEDLFLRRWSPRAFAETPIDTDTLKAIFSAGGLHTHGMACFDPEKLARSFGVPNDFEAVACWALGYRGDPELLNEQQKQIELSPRKRKALAEIVFSDWQSSAL
jgi:nitroreductase